MIDVQKTEQIDLSNALDDNLKIDVLRKVRDMIKGQGSKVCLRDINDENLIWK